MYNDVFQPWTDYKTTFVEKVDELLEQDMTLEFRKKAVHDLVEAYIFQTGKVPDGLQLSRLADYILKDDLNDPHPDKVTRTEYPILSSRQLRLRSGRELSDEMIENKTNDKKHKLNGRRRPAMVSASID